MVMLRQEVKELKIANFNLASTMAKATVNFETTTSLLIDTPLDLQSKLNKLVGDEELDSKPKEEKKAQTVVVEKKAQTMVVAEKKVSRKGKNESIWI